MANSIKEGGLILHTLSANSRVELCYHASGDSVPLGRGDAVKITGGGVAKIGSGPYVPTVARVAAGDAIYAIVENCLQQFVNTGVNLSQTHCPASTAMYVSVRIANQEDEYRITEDGALALVDYNLNANLTGNGGGTTVTNCNSVTGLSTMMLDTSTALDTATLQLKILRPDANPENTPASTNSSIIVSINNCQRSGGTGTVGIA